MRRISVSLLLVILFTGCHKMEPAPANEMSKGSIEGRVTIGPLRPGPVHRDEKEPEPPAELFAAHKIVVLSSESKQRVEETTIDEKGYYKITVAPGRYLVDVQPHDIGMGNFTPQQVTVEAGKTLTHDIDIDTGMR